MSTYTSTVSEASLLRQAVLNTSQSLELLREAMSNSVDADARNINVHLTNVDGELFDIVIEDDGNGMAERHMKAFFNAGESEKDFETTAIGEKGLGSKTTFVAKEVIVESRRFDDATHVLVGKMANPLSSLEAGQMPGYTIEMDPEQHTPSISSKGTRIELRGVRLASFNGKKASDATDIATRVAHYLRSMCATGTVKNRHSSKTHVQQSIMNAGATPSITVQVDFEGDTVPIGPVPGLFDIPQTNRTPTDGPLSAEGIAQNSKLFCDIVDFTRSKTFTLNGQTKVVHYDGTVIVAGELVRQGMLQGELARGLTHKSQMGAHLCKDFIPLRNENSLSRQLLGNEYYYEFKLFLNCQDFELNADRNVITNEETDEVAWIYDDFKEHVWPQVEAAAAPYKSMREEEDSAIIAARKTTEATQLKAAYAGGANVAVTKHGASLAFVKVPKKEADVSHLLAMMVQAGAWASELAPIAKIGQYINVSTDLLAEDASGGVLLVEVELQLPNLFKHQHPMGSYDAVVVWSLGNLADGDGQVAPWGINGANVTVKLKATAQGGWELQWGTIKKPVIVLQEII